jgi:hypothetical protein
MYSAVTIRRPAFREMDREKTRKSARYRTIIVTKERRFSQITPLITTTYSYFDTF